MVNLVKEIKKFLTRPIAPILPKCPMCGGKITQADFKLSEDNKISPFTSVQLGMCDVHPYTCPWKDWDWKQ